MKLQAITTVGVFKQGEERPNFKEAILDLLDLCGFTIPRYELQGLSQDEILNRIHEVHGWCFGKRILNIQDIDTREAFYEYC